MPLVPIARALIEAYLPPPSRDKANVHRRDYGLAALVSLNVQKQRLRIRHD
jgi:hypothetical protein